MKSFLNDEFGNAINVQSSQTACGTGAFEVTVADTLVHSKLTMGHGKCNTDEELDAIIDSIKAKIK